MAKPTEVKILLTVEGESAKELKASIKGLDDFGKQAKKTAKETSQAFETLKGVLGANALTGAFKSAFSAAKSFFKTLLVDGVNAAKVQQDALNELATAMRLSGDFSDKAFMSMQNFASELQRTTKIGDETTLQMLALAKSFGKSNEETQKLVNAAIELSAATGMSLEGAVKNLGKTYAGMTGELGESLPIIKTLTAEQLKAGEALDLILNRFGGSAAAQVKTFSGATQQASNSFGDFTEKIGFLVTNNPVVIKAINEIAKLFNLLGSEVEANQGFLNGLIKDLVIFGFTITDVTISAIQFSIEAYNRFKQAIIATGTTILEAGEKLTRFFGLSEKADIFKIAIEKNQEEFNKLNQEIDVLGSKDGTFEKVRSRINAIKSELEQTSTAVRAVQSPDGPAGMSSGAGALDEEARKKAAEEGFQKRADMLMQENEVLSKIQTDRARERVEINNIALKQIQEEELASLATRDKIEAKFAETQKAREEKRASVTRGVLTNIANLQGSTIKELAVIGKAAAITQATIDTFTGANLALATIPPPFGFIAAAAVTASGLANVAKIAGVPGLQNGMTEVPGNGFRDSVPAVLAPGERVVDRGTNQDLKSFLATNQNQTSVLLQIRDALANSNNNVTVNIGGEEITNVIRDQQLSGRSIA